MTILAPPLQQLDENQKILARYRPFTEPHVLSELQKFYRVDATYSSNALEGCTYTLSETKILLEDGLAAGGKPMREAYAVLGHAQAFDCLIKECGIAAMWNVLNRSLHARTRTA